MTTAFNLAYPKPKTKPMETGGVFTYQPFYIYESYDPIGDLDWTINSISWSVSNIRAPDPLLKMSLLFLPSWVSLLRVRRSASSREAEGGGWCSPILKLFSCTNHNSQRILGGEIVIILSMIFWLKYFWHVPLSSVHHPCCGSIHGIMGSPEPN